MQGTDHARFVKKQLIYSKRHYKFVRFIYWYFIISSNDLFVFPFYFCFDIYSNLVLKNKNVLSIFLLHMQYLLSHMSQNVMSNSVINSIQSFI